ncbi:conserved hypothetical protein [Uncinocarpus reesii 1704]|uniref:Uncharacterized protein n=1 Tax=Uncinocarpus reesii (strain UAMH 1704) TaxID=336963 RepID=C4JUT9_UNCRE|nr:uncharacterized protein UREG_04892 [Uncinocarpus reesii 1704]EEP80050.1 conserved hypothetical protein [Uncinocarpus reesii 1704]
MLCQSSLSWIARDDSPGGFLGSFSPLRLSCARHSRSRIVAASTRSRIDQVHSSSARQWLLPPGLWLLQDIVIDTPCQIDLPRASSPPCNLGQDPAAPDDACYRCRSRETGPPIQDQSIDRFKTSNCWVRIAPAGPRILPQSTHNQRRRRVFKLGETFRPLALGPFGRSLAVLRARGLEGDPSLGVDAGDGPRAATTAKLLVGVARTLLERAESFGFTNKRNGLAKRVRCKLDMPPARSCFTALNLPPDFTLPECMDYFSLSAAPNTDIWRKPPDRETTTAPILFTSLRQPFVIAEVTVTADWEMEWDQGGLVIFAGPVPRQQQQQQRPHQSTSSAQQPPQTQTQNPTQPPPPYPSLPTGRNKWVKAGLEFSAGTVNASSVSATADGADWCLSPLAPPNVPTSITSLRIKLERIGHSLWVWYQIPGLMTEHAARTPGAIGNSWRKLREVTWFFWGVEDKSVHVGVYASRPANLSMENTMWAARNGGRFTGRTDDGRGSGGAANGLVVEFEDLEIF